MNLQQLKIGTRLALCFALSIAAALAIALYARHALGRIKMEFDIVTGERAERVAQFSEMKDNLNIAARAVRNIALVDDAPRKAEEKKRIETGRARNDALWKALQAGVVETEGRRLLQAALELRAPYRTAMDQAVVLSMAGQTEAARELLLGEVRKTQAAYIKALDASITLERAGMAAAAQAVEHTVLEADRIVLAAALLCCLGGMLLAWGVTRSITRPLAAALQMAETVAEGDLGQRVEAHGKDETARLLRALQRMNDNLAGIVRQVRDASDSIATGSAQIASGNADLSQRTEEQAANLQQAAASMEQLGTTVRLNADTARTATALATDAARTAVQGGQRVGEVVATMDEISASSRQIADITGVIDGIAFQTNILALNAAVEAARAGEQGRGFGVVAAEVRTLAQRSAQAAREIKSLIGASVDKVENGSRLVAEAGRTMDEMVRQVQQVSTLMAEISSASQEQRGGIGQIGEAVAQLDQSTQQNAALVEQSAAAADSLKSQAGLLTERVAAFRV